MDSMDSETYSMDSMESETGSMDSAKIPSRREARIKQREARIKEQNMRDIQFEIRSKYVLKTRIGGGSFGNVFDITRRSDNTDFIIKIVTLAKGYKDRMQGEIDLCRRMAANGITVPIVDSAAFNVPENNAWSYGYIIMEKGTPLKDHVWTAQDMIQALRKIQNMSDLDVYCIDLKPNNTVLYKDEIYLIDFDEVFCPIGMSNADDFFKVFRTILFDYLEQGYTRLIPVAMKMRQTSNRRELFDSMCTIFDVNVPYSDLDFIKFAQYYISQACVE